MKSGCLYSTKTIQNGIDGRFLPNWRNPMPSLGWMFEAIPLRAAEPEPGGLPCAKLTET